MAARQDDQQGNQPQKAPLGPPVPLDQGVPDGMQDRRQQNQGGNGQFHGLSTSFAPLLNPLTIQGSGGTGASLPVRADAPICNKIPQKTTFSLKYFIIPRQRLVY